MRGAVVGGFGELGSALETLIVMSELRWLLSELELREFLKLL